MFEVIHAVLWHRAAKGHRTARRGAKRLALFLNRLER
jgi:hypothetical protein